MAEGPEEEPAQIVFQTKTKFNMFSKGNRPQGPLKDGPGNGRFNQQFMKEFRLLSRGFGEVSSPGYACEIIEC